MLGTSPGEEAPASGAGNGSVVAVLVGDDRAEGAPGCGTALHASPSRAASGVACGWADGVAVARGGDGAGKDGASKPDPVGTMRRGAGVPGGVFSLRTGASPAGVADRTLATTGEVPRSGIPPLRGTASGTTRGAAISIVFPHRHRMR
jgi:hypothetical protein